MGELAGVTTAYLQSLASPRKGLHVTASFCPIITSICPLKLPSCLPSSPHFDFLFFLPFDSKMIYKGIVLDTKLTDGLS